MRKINEQEYKRWLLVVLEDIDEYCKKNGITYFLSSGTALGAVRHKGYIPWDDDIDIIMKRPEYEKFVSSFETDKCKVLTFNNTKDYLYQYAKICYKRSKVVEWVVPEIKELGINIDLFPLDGMPDELIKRRIHQDRLMPLGKFKTLLIRSRKLLPEAVRFILPYRWALKRLEHIAKKYKPENCDYIGNIVGTTVRHFEAPISCFSSTVRMEFEGKQYPVPIKYRTYLKCLFGPDYMTPPPVEKRVTHHNFTAYIDD